MNRFFHAVTITICLAMLNACSAAPTKQKHGFVIYDPYESIELQVSNPLKRSEASEQQFVSWFQEQMRIADSVAIVEHSWIGEMYVASNGKFHSNEYVEYRRVPLDSADRLRFSDMLLNASIKFASTKGDTTIYPELECSFDPHHTLEIKTNKGAKFRYLACYLCGGEEIFGRFDGTVPSYLYSEFFEMAKSKNMRVEQSDKTEWFNLAKSKWNEKSPQIGQ